MSIEVAVRVAADTGMITGSTGVIADPGKGIGIITAGPVVAVGLETGTNCGTTTAASTAEGVEATAGLDPAAGTTLVATDTDAAPHGRGSTEEAVDHAVENLRSGKPLLVLLGICSNTPITNTMVMGITTGSSSSTHFSSRPCRLPWRHR